MWIVREQFTVSHEMRRFVSSLQSTVREQPFMLHNLVSFLVVCPLVLINPGQCEELPTKVTSQLNATLIERLDELRDRRWSKEQALQWYQGQPWLVGCNFTPSTASNQLEFWQKETFDPATIDRELGFAADLGMNTVRVYLHDLLWANDRDGFIDRFDHFLDIAAKHDIRPMIVVFDDCWNHFPEYGPQPEPEDGVHNSRWVQSPGEAIVLDPSQWPPLEDYLKGLMKEFGNDRRVLMWDLYNEPGNQDLHELSIPFLRQVWIWALEARPSQPLSIDCWFHDAAVDQINLNLSDVITFHHYNGPRELRKRIEILSQYGRPMICTEYMARTRGSTFFSDMPVFKQHRIGCYNWGLVAGRTNTIYQWDIPLDHEPDIWFHDILRPDGSPYDEKEVEFIKKIIKSK